VVESRVKILLFILLITSLNAKHLHKEKYYQKIFCNKLNGIMEYQLKDKARVDCLTDTYAIETDFINKYYESIGQSLYYGYKTNHKPAIQIIIKKDNDKKLKRLFFLANKLDIKVFKTYE